MDDAAERLSELGDLRRAGEDQRGDRDGFRHIPYVGKTGERSEGLETTHNNSIQLFSKDSRREDVRA